MINEVSSNSRLVKLLISIKNPESFLKTLRF
jgi:hypothetical protein